METVAIKPGQSIIDLAIQEKGSLENLSAFLIKNSIAGLGESVSAGQTIAKENTDIKNDLDFKRPQYLKRKVNTDAQTIRSQGQSLLDLKLQETGALTGLASYMLNTGLEFKNLTVGQIISVKKQDVKSLLTVKYFKNRRLRLNRGNPCKDLLATNVFDSTFDNSFE